MSKQNASHPGKTENFGTRNIRLITFLVVMGIFLAVAGPISVFRIKKWLDSRETRGKDMTAEELIRLTESGEPLSYAIFREYSGRYSESDSQKSFVIDFDHYTVRIVADPETDVLISCRLYDLNIADSGIDLLQEKPRAYLSKGN